MVKRLISSIALVGAIMSSAVGFGAQPASASMPSDLNGDRISWFSTLPCSDGAGGTSVYARAKYLVASSGTHRVRWGVYRASDDARLAFSPLGEGYGTSGYWLNFINPWSWYSSTTAETYITAFVHRWNGSSWVLVARESIPCW